MVSRVFLSARLGKAVNCNEVEPVISDIFASVQRNPHAFNGLMRCKQEAECVYRHALACSALMISLARQLNLDQSEIREAGQAGLLFDVGLSQLPIDFAQYQDDFRRIPFEVLREHTSLGYNFLHASGLSERTAQVALHHHERNDGSGYPSGLIGGDIFHGALTLNQLFSARPMLGHADYRGPVKGLYHCGSGAHPGGGVTGAIVTLAYNMIKKRFFG